MRKLAIYLAAFLMMAACGNPTKKVDQNPPDNLEKNRIEVLYFHGKQRCKGCNAIEENTKILLESDFAEELKTGTIVYKILDFSDANNLEIVKKYKISFASLLLVKYEDNVEVKMENLTELGFGFAKNNPEEFRVKLREKIQNL